MGTYERGENSRKPLRDRILSPPTLKGRVSWTRSVKAKPSRKPRGTQSRRRSIKGRISTPLWARRLQRMRNTFRIQTVSRIRILKIGTIGKTNEALELPSNSHLCLSYSVIE